ncbi:peptidase E [Patescibacteria group bacterium]|nr:peptidase E [Patescibacteria group bacterium]
MKNLFLSSNGRFIIEKGLKMFMKPDKVFKLAYITTAQKGVDDVEYIKIHRQGLTESGCDFKELDIEGKGEIELRQALKDMDAVWVEGGNTFYLLKAIKESGFAKVIKELIDKGLICFGSSAGASVACPTIETSLWKVSEKDIKDDYGVKDLRALNLVPFLLKAHYKPEERDFLKKKIKEAKYPVRILQDNQAFLVNGNEVKLIGEKKEIRL